MENWESEFLQMGVFIFFTAFLYQKGSAESKDPEKREEVDRDPRNVRDKKNAPWPVRRGGWILTLYENSLSLAFLFLFWPASFCTRRAGVPSITKSSFCTAVPRFRLLVTWAPAVSGSSRSRIGRANFWQSAAWFCLPFIFGSVDRLNQSRLMPRIPKRAADRLSSRFRQKSCTELRLCSQARAHALPCRNGSHG